MPLDETGGLLGGQGNHSVVQAERAGDLLLQKLRIWHLSTVRERNSQESETGIAIGEAGVRPPAQAPVADEAVEIGNGVIDERITGIGWAEIGGHRRQAGMVSCQIDEGDFIAFGFIRGARREEIAHALLELQLAFTSMRARMVAVNVLVMDAISKANRDGQPRN